MEGPMDKFVKKRKTSDIPEEDNKSEKKALKKIKILKVTKILI